jgi:hypothetical protein
MRAVLLEALRRVREAGGTIELTSLRRELHMSRAQLDGLLAYADDQRRGLVRVYLDSKTGDSTIALTRAGEERLERGR